MQKSDVYINKTYMYYIVLLCISVISVNHTRITMYPYVRYKHTSLHEFLRIKTYIQTFCTKSTGLHQDSEAASGSPLWSWLYSALDLWARRGRGGSSVTPSPWENTLTRHGSQSNIHSRFSCEFHAINSCIRPKIPGLVENYPTDFLRCRGYGLIKVNQILTAAFESQGFRVGSILNCLWLYKDAQGSFSW